MVLGALASLATIVPFAVARDEGIVPDGQLWLPPLLVAGVVAADLCAARAAVRRTALVAAAIGGGPMTDWAAMPARSSADPTRPPAPVDGRRRSSTGSG